MAPPPIYRARWHLRPFIPPRATSSLSWQVKVFLGSRDEGGVIGGGWPLVGVRGWRRATTPGSFPPECYCPDLLDRWPVRPV